MANPWAGEVEIVLDGVPHVARLTLGALAEMEAETAGMTMLDIARRFEAKVFSARDVMAVIVAGLRGGGWEGRAEDLARAEIAGGPLGAAWAAARLIALAFALPEGGAEAGG